MKHQSSIEPGKKRVDGDAPGEACGAIGSEPTDISRDEPTDTAHGDRAAAHYNLHGAVLSVATHGEVGPQISRDRRPG